MTKCVSAECAGLLDIVFLVDVSGSLELTGYDIHISLIRSIVEGLNFQLGRARVAFVTFSGRVILRFALGTYITAEDVISAISIGEVELGTNMAAALRAVRTQVSAFNFNEHKV